MFTPLGLDARMDPGPGIPDKAVSYARGDGRWVVDDSAWTQTGDGAIQTTPSQVVRWASQYWAPTVGGSGIDRLRFDGAATQPEGGDYAAGIVEYSDPEYGRVLSHGGGWEGFASEFIALPADRLALAMTCTAPGLLSDADTSLEALSIWR